MRNRDEVRERSIAGEVPCPTLFVKFSGHEDKNCGEQWIVGLVIIAVELLLESDHESQTCISTAKARHHRQPLIMQSLISES